LSKQGINKYLLSFQDENFENIIYSSNLIGENSEDNICNDMNDEKIELL